MNAADLWTPERVRRRLSTLGDHPRLAFERVPGVSMDGLTPAAVLIALTEIQGRMHAVFTERPDTMAEHSGEVSFPGGRTEPEDGDLLDTALREAREEVALVPEAVDVFGALVRMPTVTGYAVTTYVGEYAQPYELRPDPREIADLFMAPLNHLADPQNHRLENRQWQGYDYELHFYDYEGHVIWGATGYMLHMLLEYLRADEISTKARE